MDLVPEEAIEAFTRGRDSVMYGNTRAGLEAAAPLILAKAFDDFADGLDKEAAELSAENPKPGTAAYSVISVLVDVAQNVRARASQARGSDETCPFTHSHTRDFCGYPNCRVS